MESVTITWIDWGIWLTYFAILFSLLMIYKWSRDEEKYRYFLLGFVIKVVAGVTYVYIFNYYYTFGDTFVYAKGGSVMAETLTHDPATYFRLLVAENDNLPPDLWQFEQRITYSRGAEEWFMVKLFSPLMLISFHSYLVSTLFMSLISFWGGWKLYLVFKDILPQRKDLAFAAVFLVPSALFWGSGVMKDTFTLAGINYVIYCLYFSLFKKKFKLSLFVGALIAATVVFLMKGYIILAFLPALLFGINEMIKVEIRNKLIKRGLGLVLLLFTGSIIYIGPQFLQEASEKYTVESIESRIRGFHTWHTDVGGSSYNLGELEYTPTGVARKIPAALNVTFFRPYIWEARNPVVMLAAFESVALLLLCLMVFYKLGFRFMRYIREKPILYTFLIYSLIFGFVVGFTSYNFGALGRYKIPVYSIFAFILIYLNYFGNLNLEKRRYTAEKRLDEIPGFGRS
ncbi:MAG: hypothetical protein HYZ14_02485 [Bacteroidetes bacterium]|nr:hypothetical protein [Bacteroidota bacterium]